MNYVVCALVVSSFCIASSLALTECEALREKELKSSSKSSIKLIPRCTEDGQYESKQCFEGSKFCMCWRPDGTHITEPSLKTKSCSCIVHRDRVASRGLIGNYRPQCEADGTYARVQCHGGMGYCWCVDEHGVKNNNSIDNC